MVLYPFPTRTVRCSCCVLPKLRCNLALTRLWGIVLQGSLKIFAKDLVRTRKSIQKFHQMGAQLRGVEIRIAVSTPQFPRGFPVR
jgi:hypothetical protein